MMRTSADGTEITVLLFAGELTALAETEADALRTIAARLATLAVELENAAGAA